MSDNEIIMQIIDIGNKMYERGFVASNDGNISVRAEDGNIWVTPTMVSKGGMTPDMMIKLTPGGTLVTGKRKPSTEVAMHLCLYRENANIKAVVHAHPVTATSFSIAGIALDKPIYPEALFNLGKVPVAPYAQPGTMEVPESIKPYCRTHKAVLLANHGALTWGTDSTEAWYRMEALENYAKIVLNTYYILRQANELTEEQARKFLN
ncbi:MAG: class II aldolase/adducin family protein [Oscillospiraceae bacterium]|nr:class II aldolase/adducin family protein [Oscillospiraceae bacterium]